jgi:hypothetical protein
MADADAGAALLVGDLDRARSWKRSHMPWLIWKLGSPLASITLP